MVAQYLAIQQARLGDRLRSQLDLPKALLSQTLPSGLLLTLVENALEHGVGPALQGGEVQVSAAAGAGGVWLRVDNSGQPLVAPAVLGVGLRNCLERLQRLKGPQATLQLSSPSGGGTRAEVWLPGATA
jgi:LytS/YehU family sensor histidine kinase